MLRAAMILAAIAMAVMTVHADDFVVIRTSVPDTEGLTRVPLLATTDADGLRQATRLAALPAGALYAQEMPSGRPVEMQLTIAPDGQAEFAGLLPTEPPGPREIRVWLQNPPAAPPAPPLTISAERAGEIVRVRGDTYQVVHDPAVNAGILSQITFLATDRVFVPQMNDRVHSKQIGGFALRKDPDAEVTLVADGPYMAEVRVSARYVNDEAAAPETQPRATYVFRYWAGLSVFSASAEVEQNAGFAWDELHFLEIHFQDESFTQFAAGNAEAVTDFVDDSQGTRAPNWGALIDGANVLGLTGSLLIYDGLPDYGRYLHGPWAPWGGRKTGFRRWLYVNAGAEALQEFATIASGPMAAEDGALLTEGLAELFGRLHARASASSDAPQAGRIDWRVSLVETVAVSGAPLGQVQTAAAALEQAIGAGRWREFSPGLPGGRLLLADDGRLGVGLRLTDTGVELASLYDMLTRREMLAGPCELFELTLTDAERTPASLRSADGWRHWNAQMAGDESSATITASFESPTADGLGAMQAQVTCEIADGESRWRLSVDNDTAWSIDRVTMPGVRIRALGETGLDDTLYVPHGYGRSFPGGTGTRYVGYYPSGSCALPLLLITDERGGVYVAAHDPAASTRNMVSNSGSGAGGVPLSIDTPAPDASVAGNDFTTSGEMVIARVDGGWYPATQKYRAWLQQNAPWWPEGDPDYGRDDRPAWLDDVAAWVLYGGGPETVVEPTKAFAEYMGLPVAIHWYNWHEIPFDNDYPHYFPTRGASCPTSTAGCGTPTPRASRTRATSTARATAMASPTSRFTAPARSWRPCASPRNSGATRCTRSSCG